MPIDVDLSTYAINTFNILIEKQKYNLHMYDVKRWGAIPAAKFIADKQEIDYLQITKDIVRSGIKR